MKVQGYSSLTFNRLIYDLYDQNNKLSNEQASQNKPQNLEMQFTNSINIDKPDDTKSNCMRKWCPLEWESVKFHNEYL